MQTYIRESSARTVYLLTSLVLMLLATAGCGGGGQPATEAGQPTATQVQAPAATRTAEPARNEERTSSNTAGCELLTKEEVAQAMGEPVTNMEDSGLRGCEWKTGERTEVLLDVFSGSTLAENTCAVQRSLEIGREENVPDLGDSALWKSSGSLVVCTAKAVVVFNIDNSSSSPDEEKEAAITMARLVLGRL